MSSIPIEIQEEILLCLPVKSLSRFNLILTTKNPRIMFKDANYSGDRDMFYSVSYASILAGSTSGKCDGAVLMEYYNPVIQDKCHRYMKILGSCNGLLCLGATSSNSVVLWNPSSSESKKILLPIRDIYIKSYGFGYDSSTTDYKLVCIAWREVHIYTLKSDSWKELNITPFGQIGTQAGLLLNGALHWKEDHNAIISFNISSEKLVSWPIPEEIILRPTKYSCAILKVLGDSLCLVCGILSVGAAADVWVMQSYGVRESWIKKFTTNQGIITSYPSWLELYWSIGNGEILIQVYRDFALDDQKNDRIRFLNFSGIKASRFDCLESVSYVESLVSLDSGT